MLFELITLVLNEKPYSGCLPCWWRMAACWMVGLSSLTEKEEHPVKAKPLAVWDAHCLDNIIHLLYRVYPQSPLSGDGHSHRVSSFYICCVWDRAIGGWLSMETRPSLSFPRTSPAVWSGTYQNVWGVGGRYSSYGEAEVATVILRSFLPECSLILLFV